jgi:hypothetical protein
MCGIAGYVSTQESLDPRLTTALALLGVFMEDRGRQSWGYSDGDRIIKRVGSFRGGAGPGLFGSNSALVHTRQATTGDRTAENSHPFDIKGIIGCHNGMIYNHKAAAEKFGITYQVDSELIFHLLADGQPLTELEGYGAIAYFREGKMHLGRFSNRGDMALAMTDAGWIFASTKIAVEDAAGITGIKVADWVDVKLGELYQLDGDQLVVMPTELKISDMKPTYSGAQNWQDFRGGYSEGYTAGQGTYAGGHWDNKTQKWISGSSVWDSKLRQWVSTTPANQLPLPTAQTTTFTSEPDSDSDEVIDVTDAEFTPPLTTADKYAEDEAAYYAAASNLSGPQFQFSPEDFIKTTPADFTGRIGGEYCDECDDVISGDEALYVEKYSETFICEQCYVNNYDEANTDFPTDEPLTGFDFTKEVIAEMTRCNLLNSGLGAGVEGQSF